MITYGKGKAVFEFGSISAISILKDVISQRGALTKMYYLFMKVNFLKIAQELEQAFSFCTVKVSYSLNNISDTVG